MSLLFGEIVVFEVQNATICWTVASHKTSICFLVLLCGQNASPLLFKVCHLSIALLMFLRLTPKIWITCLLLLVLSYVAKARTISLAMTVNPDFWPLKCFVKPHLDSLQHFSSLLISLDHESTLVHTKLTKTFSTAIALKEIEYSFKKSKMNKDIVLASVAFAFELITH